MEVIVVMVIINNICFVYDRYDLYMLNIHTYIHTYIHT